MKENIEYKYKKRSKMSFAQAMEDASVVTSPANILVGPRKNEKVLGGYNRLVY